MHIYVPGCTHILYSEDSYVTVHSLKNLVIDIDLTMRWQDGQTALMFAAQEGHSNVVETLLQHGAT